MGNQVTGVADWPWPRSWWGYAKCMQTDCHEAVKRDTRRNGCFLPEGQEVGSSNLPSPTPKELIRAGANSTGSLLFRLLRTPGLQNACMPVRRTVAIP